MADRRSDLFSDVTARRYDAVDPDKRLVAQGLEARWNTALEQVAEIEQRLYDLDRKLTSRPGIE